MATATAHVSNSKLPAPIPFRMRQDLQYSAQRVDGRPYWCVKDPVSLEYFHLKDEEFSILKMLDGRVGVADVLSRFNQLFAPLRISAVQLQAFLEKLLYSGLVVSDLPQSDDALFASAAVKQRRNRLRLLTNVLAIRFRGVDPDRFLGWLHDRIAWMLGSLSLILGTLIMLSALAVVVSRFGELRHDIPRLGEFLTVGNVAVLALSLAILKILHELSHGLACKHYGGECHEMGVLLLVFTPCLYCDVSDAWMLPQKWRRIAISAAGIYAELLVASICTIIWATSQPGFLHTLCLNIMLVASVNTIMFNGNFLRRYDGYYIFSDWMEIPNLAQRAGEQLRRTLGRLLFGIEPASNAFEPKRALLLTYGIASTLYLWFLMGAILWFCHRVLKPHGLVAVADVLTFMTIAGLVVPVVLFAVRVARTPAMRGRIRAGRTMFTLTIVAIVAALICLMPAPYSVDAVATLQPANAQRVYAPFAGMLEEFVDYGASVEKGQVLARLENPELTRDVERLQGELNEAKKNITNIEARLLDDPGAAGRLPAARESLKDIEQQLAQRTRDKDELTLRAPTAGIVLPPPYRPELPLHPERLETWSGYPLENKNRGCFLESGTLVCLVGSPTELESILLVDETEIPFVEKDRDVRIQFDERPGTIFPAVVSEVSADNLTIAPPELAFGNRLAVRSDELGHRRLLENTYQVRATFTPTSPEPLCLRATGRAKISGPYQTVGSRIYRYLRRTFGMQW